MVESDVNILEMYNLILNDYFKKYKEHSTHSEFDLEAILFCYFLKMFLLILELCSKILKKKKVFFFLIFKNQHN